MVPVYNTKYGLFECIDNGSQVVPFASAICPVCGLEGTADNNGIEKVPLEFNGVVIYPEPFVNWLVFVGIVGVPVTLLYATEPVHAVV